MAAESFFSSVEKSLMSTMTSEAESIKERVIKDALDDFEKHIRRTVGNVAIDLSRYFSVQRQTNELVITIHQK